MSASTPTDQRWVTPNVVRPLDVVEVVVPVHNEEELLPHCLTGLHAARRTAEAAGIRVGITLVLDACTDGSRAIAAAAATDGMRMVTVQAHNVGLARAAGFAAALHRAEAGADTPTRQLARPRYQRLTACPPSPREWVDPERIWLATTDADSVVPEIWLLHQLTLAAAGVDLILGTVIVDDWSNWPSATRTEYLQRYETAAAGVHPHVHGANLGIRAALYNRIGGFPGLSTGEDRALAGMAIAVGAHAVAVTDLPVLTSGRPRARALEGFSTYLHDLTAEVLEPASSCPPRHMP